MTALSIAVSGNGPDLALIHGWGYDSRVFDEVATGLAASCRVHQVDLPGYGRNRELAPVSLPDLADLLRDALPGGTTLGGWSLGGQVALSALARNPRHFRRLVLISSTPCFVSAADWPHGVAPMLLAGFARALRADSASLFARFGALVNQGDTRARELTRRLATVYGDGPPAAPALAQGLDWLRDLDFRPLLGKLAHPVLLAHGAHDPLIPLSAAQSTRERLSNARLEVFPQAAHAPFLSDPERFVAVVAGFVAESAPETATAAC